MNYYLTDNIIKNVAQTIRSIVPIIVPKLYLILS